MAKPQPSMDDALKKHKRLRQKLASETNGSGAVAELTVVSDAAPSSPAGSKQPTETTDERGAPPVWVRHTVGLKAETSLALKEAADRQKRKKRRGLLKPGEPATEQEIAEMAISRVLKEVCS